MIFEKTCLRHRRNIVYLVCSFLNEVAFLSKPTEYPLQRVNRPSRDSTVLRLTTVYTSWLHDTKHNDRLGICEQRRNCLIIKGLAGWLSGESLEFYLKGTAFEPEPVHRLSLFKIVRGFIRLIDVNSKDNTTITSFQVPSCLASF